MLDRGDKVKDFIKETYNEISSFLNDNIEHQNKEIAYILYEPITKETRTLATDGIENSIEFDSRKQDYSFVAEWDYNFDYYLYDLFQNGMEIGYMSDDVHYSIWNSINELYPTDIECKDGVKYYIEYCRQNNITKDYIDSKTGFDTPDIMSKFNNEKIKVLIVEPSKLPEEIEIENTLEAKQKIVGGDIECAYIPGNNDVVLICNEEGKVLNMPLNRFTGNDIIAGTFLIVGDDYENGDFKSLTKNQINKYKKYFDEKSIRAKDDIVQAIKITNMLERFDER